MTGEAGTAELRSRSRGPGAVATTTSRCAGALSAVMSAMIARTASSGAHPRLGLPALCAPQSTRTERGQVLAGKFQQEAVAEADVVHADKDGVSHGDSPHEPRP